MDNTRPNVTILVNSSDGFEDCWQPFFFFLRKNWPDLNYPVILNTEVKPFWDDAAKATQVALGEEAPLTWSECLLRALDQVETPLVLYMQEDYFIDHPVDHSLILQHVSLMMEDEDVKHIGLTRHGSLGPHLPAPFAGLKAIKPDARYRISTQAGLWRVETLRSYLDPSESGWMFEIFGTLRARRRKDLFLTVDVTNSRPPIDYIHTGIIKGRWHRDVEPLFRRNAIDIDFSRRGFYKPPPFILGKFALLKKLLENPKHAVQQITAG